MAQSSGPENIYPVKSLQGLLAQAPVLCPARLTLESNEKTRPEPDWENAFAGASGGGDGTEIQRSPPRNLLIHKARANLLSATWFS